MTASSARRKSGEARVVRAGDRRVPRLLRRAEQHRVAGRGVAVDGDRIERRPGRRRQQRLQHLGRQCRVGKDIGEHRRHVRRDHARAFGEAVEPHGRAVDRRGRGGALRKRVGGHDRPRRRFPGLRRQFFDRLGQRRDDAFGRRRLADHAGRGDEHLAWVAAEQPRGGRRGRLDDLPAGAAGEHVRIAGIDDDRADLAARQALPAPHDRMPRRSATA